MRINVSGLEFYGFHGVSPEERKVGQRLLVDLELEVRSKAEQTDRIQDTVDYGAVSLKAMEVGQQTQFHTLERLAQEIGSTKYPGETCSRPFGVRNLTAFVWSH
jgi:dihydroneopterin aldolase